MVSRANSLNDIADSIVKPKDGCYNKIQYKFEKIMVDGIINFSQSLGEEDNRHGRRNKKLFLYAVLLFATLGLPCTWIGIHCIRDMDEQGINSIMRREQN